MWSLQRFLFPACLIASLLVPSAESHTRVEEKLAHASSRSALTRELAFELSVSTFGNCSLPATRVNVSSISDIYSRTSFPTSTLVILTLLSDVTLSVPLYLFGNFSCTVFTSNTPGGNTISYPSNDVPAIVIWSTTNILFNNINMAIYISPSQQNSYIPLCNSTFPLPFESYGYPTCPAVHVYNSFGITISQGNIFGRVDILRSANIWVDSNNITGYSNYLTGSDGVGSYLRVWQCGNGAGLVQSAVQITNNMFSGLQNTGILLYQYAVGVVVANNIITNVSFTGIQCGCCFSVYGDCMLNTLSNNFIYFLSSVSAQNGDSGGIYMDLKWTNPGNLLSCNYIYGGSSCIYGDVASSGYTVQGGVCYNTRLGVKVNYGKAVVVTSLILHKGSTNGGYISCFGVCQFNCFDSTWWVASDRPTSTSWLVGLYGPLSNKNWQASFPWTVNICYQASILGINCNPTSIPIPANCQPAYLCSSSGGTNLLPAYRTSGIVNTTQGNPSAQGNMTGYCSGLPYLNYLSIIGIDASTYTLGPNGDCCAFPSVTQMNYMSVLMLPNATVGFNNIAGQDYGVNNLASPIYSLYPGFYSCPRALVGPQANNGPLPAHSSKLARAALGELGNPALGIVKYARKFNRRAKPNWFSTMVKPLTLDPDQVKWDGEGGVAKGCKGWKFAKGAPLGDVV